MPCNLYISFFILRPKVWRAANRSYSRPHMTIVYSLWEEAILNSAEVWLYTVGHFINAGVSWPQCDGEQLRVRNNPHCCFQYASDHISFGEYNINSSCHRSLPRSVTSFSLVRFLYIFWFLTLVGSTFVIIEFFYLYIFWVQMELIPIWKPENQFSSKEIWV